MEKIKKTAERSKAEFMEKWNQKTDVYKRQTVSELVDNALEHAVSDCLIDIDVTEHDHMLILFQCYS